VSTLGRRSEPQSICRRLLSYTVTATLGVLGLIVGPGAANAQPITPKAVAPVGPPQTYSYWTLPVPAGNGYNRLYQTVTPSNMPAAGPGQAAPAYFYAMQWYNANDLSVGGYIGLQTDDQGKKAIFSWWGGINGHGPGISQPFSGEGSGWQTIIPYDWQARRSYRLNVNHSSTTSSGSWFTATVVDVQANRTSTIGTIEIPSSFGGIYQYINNFVEWYGPAQAGCTNYPHSDVTFSAPQGREQVGRTTTTAAAGNPPSATPNGPGCSAVTDDIASMEHINGTP
jgi:Domain of unknown function (DUF3472)